MSEHANGANVADIWKIIDSLDPPSVSVMVIDSKNDNYGTQMRLRASTGITSDLQLIKVVVLAASKFPQALDGSDCLVMGGEKYSVQEIADLFDPETLGFKPHYTAQLVHLPLRNTGIEREGLDLVAITPAQASVLYEKIKGRICENRSIKKIDSAHIVTPSTEHPDYCADVVYPMSRLTEGTYVAAVMDGVGSGEEKSVKAAQAVSDRIILSYDKLSHINTAQQARAVLNEILGESAIRIKSIRENSGADTTATIAIIYEDNEGRSRIAILNSGDSRAYIIRPSGFVAKITNDQSVVQRLVDLGAITKEEAFVHSQRNLILGTVAEPGPGYSFYDEQINPGDIVLLTTDGITDNIHPARLNGILRASVNNKPEDIISNLLAEACARVGMHKPDDIGAVVMKVI